MSLAYFKCIYNVILNVNLLIKTRNKLVTPIPTFYIDIHSSFTSEGIQIYRVHASCPKVRERAWKMVYFYFEPHLRSEAFLHLTHKCNRCFLRAQLRNSTSATVPRPLRSWFVVLSQSRLTRSFKGFVYSFLYFTCSTMNTYYFHK